MQVTGKYRQFESVALPDRTWPSKRIEKPPVWCSVDLRDGNQALINPMGIEQKLEFFDLLVKLGFKEIEVGFPSSNDTEYEFVRRLITENRVPAPRSHAASRASISMASLIRRMEITALMRASDGLPPGTSCCSRRVLK